MIDVAVSGLTYGFFRFLRRPLNRLELMGRSERYHKINDSAEAIDRLLVDHYLELHLQPPKEVALDLDATDTPLYGQKPEPFFHRYADAPIPQPVQLPRTLGRLIRRIAPSRHIPLDRVPRYPKLPSNPLRPSTQIS